MAISKVVYGTTVLLDLTSDTVDAAHLAKGYTAHDAAGNQVVGTLGEQQQIRKNLLKGTSDSLTDSSDLIMAFYDTTEPLVVGNTYTISAYVEKLECTDNGEFGVPLIAVCDGAGAWLLGALAIEGEAPVFSHTTFTYKQIPPGADPNKICMLNTPGGRGNATRVSSFKDVMLVEGSTPSAWAPAEGE